MNDNLPKVLVIDDDPYELALMSLYLKPIAEVRTAQGGQRAIELVQKFPVDIILLDVNMPVMNGFKTLERLRNLKECINVPVILVTGQHDRSTVMNSVFAGTDGYLVKPVQKEELQKRVLELYQKNTAVDNRKTILAIDDDMAYLKLIYNYLQDKYNVVIINSASLAYNYLAKHTPDLILLDYEMPLYNGATFLNMLKRKTDSKSIPVIILSGVLNKKIISDCYANNPETFLAKPVSKEKLLENIEHILYQ